MKKGWDYKELGECCDILDSKRKPITKNKRILGDIPYYGATGILDYVKDYIFDEKLVLIGEDGAKWGAGENTAYIIDGKSWVNNHAHAIRPNRQCIIDEFLVFYLNYSDLSDKITGVTVPKLNQEKMRGIILPVPSLSEQQQIVSFLDSEFEKIDALKANAETQLQAAKDLFQKALKEMLTPKDGWEEKKLGEICDFRSGFAFKSSLFTESGEPIIRISDIQNGEIEDSKVVYFNLNSYKENLNKFKVYPNDILIAMSGATTGKVGINKTDKVFYLNQRVGVFRENTKILEHKYLYYFLNNKAAESLKLAIGAAQPNLSTEQINNFIVPIPSLTKQQAIADNLDTLSAKVKQLQENYNETITLCNDLKQALLKKVFE